MKNLLKYTLIPLFAGLSHLVYAQQYPSIIINTNETKQVIEGFGVAEADWADDVFIFPQREEVLNALFGENGLKLNILRGEIFPHYSDKPFHYDFAIKSDTSMNTVRNASSIEKNDLLRRGQFWLTSHVQQKYPNTLFTFSVWSPPAWMKVGGYSTPDYPASHGSLKKEHYQSYADYLCHFYQAYKSIGVDTYAISPSNEPGYAAPWNSCEWTYDEMGEFIHKYLLPTFKRNSIPTKVLFGENPAWSTVFDRLKMISSADFCNDLLKKYPLDADRVIAAGHGYVLPDTLPLPANLRRTPIIPFVEAQKRNIPMWVTEISDITPLDTSMKDGLYWAETFHKYLMEAQVSAIVWWCGAQPTHTNESLIILDKKSDKYTLSKRYETFGNYSRYIPKGSQCVSNRKNNVPAEICISSFTHDKQFIVVIVNPTNKEINSSLSLEGKECEKKLKSYTTTGQFKWKEGKVSPHKGKYQLKISPQSVVTYVGRMN